LKCNGAEEDMTITHLAPTRRRAGVLAAAACLAVTAAVAAQTPALSPGRQTPGAATHDEIITVSGCVRRDTTTSAVGARGADAAGVGYRLTNLSGSTATAGRSVAGSADAPGAPGASKSAGEKAIADGAADARTGSAEYRLLAEPAVDLRAAVDHTVRVTGILAPAVGALATAGAGSPGSSMPGSAASSGGLTSGGSSPTPATAAPPPAFMVQSVTMISENCGARE
jgi:hypothetical protein